MVEYIERESLLCGFGSPESGLDDIIDTLIFEHNLDFLHDCDEDEVRAFAKDLIGKVKNYILTEPTADVVKVVRCKDCDFVQPTQIKLNGKDLKTCELYKRPCFDNDFCSRGLLKECEGK